MPSTPAQANAERRSLPTTALGLAIALLVPLIVVTLPVDLGRVVVDAIKWSLVAALAVLVVGYEGLPGSALGYRRPRLADAGWALAIAVAGIGALVAIDPVLTDLGLATRSGIPQPSLAYGLFAAVTAGVTEEVIYRSYPIERLTTIGASPLLAGAITWVVFTVAHAPTYPAGSLVKVGIVGAILTAVYLRTRSLAPVIGGHVLIDVFGVLAFFAA